MPVHSLLPSQVHTLRERYRARILKEWRYEQFFKFLQLSPSYRLVRLKAAGKLKAARTKIPIDLDVVERTYLACGDVTKTYFWEWWFETGQYVFGSNVRSKPRLLLKVGAGERTRKEDILAAQHALTEFADVDRFAAGQPAVLVAAIPLSGGRNAILRAFNTLLSAHVGASDEQAAHPQYKFEKNKIRKSTVASAGALAVLRAANPTLPLYVLGNAKKVSSYVTPRQRSRMGFQDERRLMEIMTSRQLRRAYIIAEHAARGVFPCLDPLPDDPGRPPMDFLELGKQLSSTIKALEQRGAG